MPFSFESFTIHTICTLFFLLLIPIFIAQLSSLNSFVQLCEKLVFLHHLLCSRNAEAMFDVVFYLVEGELSRNTDSKHTQVIRIVTLEGLMARGRQSGKELAHKNRSE